LSQRADTRAGRHRHEPLDAHEPTVLVGEQVAELEHPAGRELDEPKVVAVGPGKPDADELERHGESMLAASDCVETPFRTYRAG
jgi:hypothetical protein